MSTVRRMSVWANTHAVDGSESEEEDPPQRFLLGKLQDSLNVRRHHRAAHTGLRRRMGCWKFGEHRHAPGDSDRYYSGTHWDVELDPMRDDLERPDREHTGRAVDKQMDREKARRMQEEGTLQQLAVSVLTPLNREMRKVLTDSQCEMEHDQEEQKQRASQLLSDAQAELVHRVRGQEVEDECEEERLRREDIMDALMGNKEKIVRTDSFTNLLKSLSDTDDKMAHVQNQLMTAFFRMEDDDEQDKQEEEDLYKGMHDDLITEIKHASGGLRSQVHTESERKEKLFASHDKEAEAELGESRDRVFGAMDGVMEEMMRIYAGVKLDLGQKEEQEEIKTRTVHTAAMQELSKRSLKQQVHRACAHERARRIREAAELARRPDPGRDMLRELVARVQEEMLIKKFHGRKVAFREPEQSPYSEEENEQDRMLRHIRLSARRKSCAVAF